MIPSQSVPDDGGCSEVATTKRLIVDHIVLENFKSYAGRQVIGPFHENFTSIVGPNGSGKSNVIDAFMFVLGYRAKKLRQGRISELIHNSEGLLNLESCSVECHFKLICNDDNLEEAEKLCVSRTAYRNNSNKYHIDGQLSNFAEVTTLLKNYGVDLDHKRFLILQGEVESIAQMKPKAATEHEEGLLEYLEDIIGTNKYIEKIEEAGKAVDLSNDLCAEKVVRVKAAEREVLSLVGEKEEAEKFIKMENELKTKKTELYQILKFQAEKLVDNLTEKIEEVKIELSVENEKNKEKCLIFDEIEKNLKEFVNEKTKYEADISISLKKLTQFELEDIKLQETRKHLKNKMKSLVKSLSEETKNRNNILKEISDSEEEIRIIGETVQKLKKELVMEERELSVVSEALKGKTGDLQIQLEKLQKQLSPWTEKICTEQDALEGAVLALGAFEKKQRSIGNELLEAKKQLSVVETEYIEAQNNHKLFQQRRQEFAEEIERFEGEIMAGEEIQTSLASTINTIQATLAEANEALRQGNSGSAALSALMKESTSGRIKGVHGRLGDLGIIDSKYDCAITTACSSLNFIVVDDTAAGQKCVEFLRRNNLGRASFIILEKMRRPDMCPNYLPTGAQRLFDLVQVKNEKFLSAFYFGLNDTLVGRDMEEATKLAYGGSRRFRVVTMDGKLIDTSGTMSGGGHNQQSGGMKATFTPEISREQIAELNAVLTEKLAEQKSVKSGLMQFQEMLSRVRIELKRNDMDMGKIEIAIRSLPQQILDLKDSIENIRNKDVKPDKEDLEKRDKLKAQVLQNELNIQELNSSCSSIRELIEKCQNEILESGGTKFKSQRIKVNDLKEQIKLQEKMIEKLASKKSSLERRQEGGELSKSLGSQDQNLSSTCDLELKEIESKMEEITREAFKLKKEHEKMLKESEDLNEKIFELKLEQEKVEKELRKFRKKEFELKLNFENLTKEIEEVKIKKILFFEKLLRDTGGDITVGGRGDNDAAAHIGAEALRAEGSSSSSSFPSSSNSYYPLSNDDLMHLYKDKHYITNIESSISRISSILSELKPNLKVIKEFKEKESIFNSQRKEFEELEIQRNFNRTTFENLRKTRHEEFMNGFRQVSLRLKELYQLITMGGNAELELVDSLDPFAEGILFSVMPPKKSWKNISNLSGGEKTLSSLALVFALHTFKPTPIYVMDEIDAALDFRNVSIVAEYLKKRTRDAQFIVISLRNNMFELADRLVGIYKTDQKTKSVTIDPKAFTIKTK